MVDNRSTPTARIGILDGLTAARKCAYPALFRESDAIGD